MKKQGSISVFLSLSFVLVAALLLTITESARSISQRLYMQVALDSAMESLFSQYHRPLWDRYRLFALEYRDDADLAEELYDFMQPYLNARDLFPARISEDNIRFSSHAHLPEDCFFEEEVLEYMRYGVFEYFLTFCGLESNESSLSEILKRHSDSVLKSEIFHPLQQDYRLDIRELNAIEACISEINELCALSENSFMDAGASLKASDAGEFSDNAAAFRKNLEGYAPAAEAYEKAADRLQERLLALRSRFNAQRSELGEEAAQIVEAQLSEYEHYLSEGAGLRRQIEAMPARATQLSEISSQMELRVLEFEAELEERRQSAEDPEEDSYEEDFSEEIDDFYSSCSEEWFMQSPIRPPCADSSFNESAKKQLEKIEDFSDSQLLNLVLSKYRELPSREPRYPSVPPYAADSEASPVELALLGEYSLKFFHSYCESAVSPDGFSEYDLAEKLRKNGLAMPKTAKLLPSSPSLSPALAGFSYRELAMKNGPAEKKPVSCELEYLIAGKSNDEANLTVVVKRLLLLREMMNLLYLYSSPEKRAEARAMALAFFSVSANPILISLFTFFLLGLWAYVQAICDVRFLLEEARIPMLHDAESWSTDIYSLFTLAGGRHPENHSTTCSGLSYEDYLRLLLYQEGLRNQSAVNSRMLSCIESNLNSGETQPAGTFVLGECLYGLSASVETEARHLLYEQGIIHLAAGAASDPSYSFTVSSYYKYKNDSN